MPIVGAPSTTAELILDPVSEDAANVEVELTDDNNYGLTAHSYPTPPAVFQWASSVSTEGARLSSQRHENRTITISVEATGLGALYDLEQKITKLWREGGTLQRTFSDGRVIVFDVLTVQDYDATFEQLHHLGGVTPVTVPLICKPYGRGAEQTLTDHAETTLPVLVFTEADIPGDMPALGRLLIDNDVAATQGLLVWGMQSRHYSSASTAALFYEAEACAMVGAAAAAGPAGASGSGSNVAHHTGVDSGSWDGLVYIGASATAQTHIGQYRVFARVQASAANPGTVSLRATWQPYVGALSISNTPVVIEDSAGVAIEGAWVIADLGEINIPQATVGTQGWIGQIDATATHPNPHTVDIDWVMLVPVDEGSGQAISYTSTAKPLIASGSLTVRHDGVLASQAGGYWAKPPSYEGDYLTVPPSGAEARTLRVVTKMARGVTGATITTAGGRLHLDPNIDDISAQLFVTPRFLVVPDA